MFKNHIRVAAVTGCILAAVGVIATPTTASALSQKTTTATIPLVPDCSRVTEKERLRMDEARLGLCGARGATQMTRGLVPGTCGSASVYTERMSSGKGRVSWGLNSTKGFMVARNLTVSWGPAAGTTMLDVSGMYTHDYSNSRTVIGKGKLGATMHGSVGLLGWTITCNIPAVYAPQINI